MNLEEFRKALSSDATEDNIRLKEQLEDTKVKYQENLSKLKDENDFLKESCRVLCNRCFTLTGGVFVYFAASIILVLIRMSRRDTSLRKSQKTQLL